MGWGMGNGAITPLSACLAYMNPWLQSLTPHKPPAIVGSGSMKMMHTEMEVSLGYVFVSQTKSKCTNNNKKNPTVLDSLVST